MTRKRQVVVQSIFSGAAPRAGQEDVHAIFEAGSTSIRRIVSHAHISPPGFWYDQTETEWVMVARGAAVVEFTDGSTANMKAGDYVVIPPHLKHRIQHTAAETIWVAVHVKEP